MRLISETALPKTHLVYLHVELGFAVRVDGEDATDLSSWCLLILDFCCCKLATQGARPL